MCELLKTMYELLDVIIMFQPWLCLDILMAKRARMYSCWLPDLKKNEATFAGDFIYNSEFKPSSIVL